MTPVAETGQFDVENWPAAIPLTVLIDPLAATTPTPAPMTTTAEQTSRPNPRTALFHTRTVLGRASEFGGQRRGTSGWQEPRTGYTSDMKPAEVAEELAQPGAAELLRSTTLARIAYTGPDGFPRVIPIGFHWDGERFVACTAPTSPKASALSSDGHVAITIDTDANEALLMRGIAVLEAVDGVPEEFIAASKKAMEGRQLEEFEAQARSLYKQMVHISVRPEWARFYDFGAGRLPRFLSRPVEDMPATGTRPTP
jgi:hypothetical protein